MQKRGALILISFTIFLLSLAIIHAVAYTNSGGTGNNDSNSPDSLDQQTNESCFDGTKNGNETGIDCGGPCNPCLNQTAQQNDSDLNNPVQDSFNPLPQIMGSNSGADNNLNNPAPDNGSNPINQEGEITQLSPKKINTPFIVSLAVNVFLLVTFVSFTLISKKKKPPVKPAITAIKPAIMPQPQQTDPYVINLRNYIEYYTKQGYDPNQIRQYLIMQQRCPVQKVDEAFNSARMGDELTQ